jgi:hypothetical protein
MEIEYGETSIYRSRIYRSISVVPEQILFKVWKKNRINRSSIYRFPASIGRNSWAPWMLIPH